jgi:hypothetical protein
MQPLVHLKKQSRKLTDSLASLQNELRSNQIENNSAFNSPQFAPEPPPHTLPPTEAGDSEIRAR